MIGSIYKLTPYNSDDFYIGSTTDMKDRKRTHEKRTNAVDDARNGNSKLYKKIRECNGFNMVLIYSFECKNKTHLRQVEQEYINKLTPQLNTNKAYISKEERLQEQRNYHYGNRDRALELQKIRYIKNKEQIAKKKKIKYELNNKIITCECGCDVKSGYLSKHIKTEKHKRQLPIQLLKKLN